MVQFPELPQDVAVIGVEVVGRAVVIAVAHAVVRVVAAGGDYPVVPAQLLEAHVEAVGKKIFLRRTIDLGRIDEFNHAKKISAKVLK